MKHNTQEMRGAVVRRAEQRRKVAHHILTELDLRERWSAFGRPVLVGAVAYDLVVSPDIDLEIYCPVLWLRFPVKALLSPAG